MQIFTTIQKIKPIATADHCEDPKSEMFGDFLD